MKWKKRNEKKTLLQGIAPSNFLVQAVGGDEPMRRRLLELGFVPGSQITLLQRWPGGCVVSVRGSNIVLDATLARCLKAA